MATISAFEAKTKFGDLLRRVRQGEEITITWRSVPVARLVRHGQHNLEHRQRLAAEILQNRPRLNPPGLPPVSLKDLIEEGRR